MKDLGETSRAAELIIKAGDGRRALAIRDGEPFFAGRAAECDLYLPSPSVSRRHAVFMARNGEFGVKDMDSSNGTWLNGKRISRPTRLKNGDIIQIADYHIEFRIPAIGRRNAPEARDLSRQTTVFVNIPPPVPPPATQPGQAGLPGPAASRKTPDHPAAPAREEEQTHAAFAAEDRPAGKTTAMNLRAFFPPETDAESEPAGPAGAAAVPGLVPAPPPPSAPPARPAPPARAEISDEEVGDGGDDAAFLLEEDAAIEDDADGSRLDAIDQAAAEAGIVGEFAPDLEEDGSAGAGGLGDRMLAGPLQAGALPAMPANPDAILLDDSLRQAVETRLFLYSFLEDMRQERKQFIARRPKMPDAVKAELARQDREIDKLPSPDQAENMIEKRRAKQAAIMEKIREARAKGEPPPPKPSRDMREAEELAISQWTVIAQSGREALPAVYGEAFRLAGDEPLVGFLRQAGVDPVPLLGGGVYYLALEAIGEETRAHRQHIRTRLANVAPADRRNGGKPGGMLGIFGKNGAETPETADAPGESHAELTEADRQLACRAAWVNQETASLEKALIQEFWRVYAAVALFFLPNHEGMPQAVRVFLRHGAIGFKKWWMRDEVRNHILDDCANEVVHHLRAGRDNTSILYADEYLAAVMNLECTPALDENLEINERNSPNWKADKALRKLINARTQSVLMEELIGSLAGRVEGLEAEAAIVDDKISKLLTGTKNYKQVKNELAQKRQAYRVEITKLTNLQNRIKNETLATLREAETETEERFASGELPRPAPDFLIRRECEALRKIGRLLANLKERFMPLVLREHFHVGTDAVNDRLAVRGEILEMERRDPAIFLENIVPSKKKANRVDLRISPVIVLIPSAGVLAYSWNPRARPEDGRLAIPTCFIRRRIRERQMTYLLSDFRWDTSKAAAGMDIMTSDTIVAAFMTVRWDWRKRSKEAREKGLIYTEQNDRTNWRRVYESYVQTAFDSGKKLYNRNYDFYERIIGKYFDLPDGAQLLRK